MLNQRERVGAGVDRKHSDAVVAPIRGIKKPAVGMNFQLSRVVGPTKVLRQGRNGLEFFEGTTSAFITEYRHERSHFTKRVGRPAVGVECKVTGARALTDLSEGRIGRREGGVGVVQAVRKNLIQSEVRHEDEAVVGR